MDAPEPPAAAALVRDGTSSPVSAGFDPPRPADPKKNLWPLHLTLAMRVFARRLPAFTHVEHVAVAFAGEQGRARLLGSSAPGDMIVVVGLAHEPTAPESRGKLLGVVEFAPLPVALAELCDVGELPDTHLASQYTPAWPFALPVLRAWTFDEPRMRVSDAFREPLVIDPIERVVELDAEEVNLVHLLPKTEIQAPYEALRRQAGFFARTIISLGPTTGLKPSAWTANVTDWSTRHG